MRSYIYYEMGYAADMEIVQSIIHRHDNEPRIDRRRASDDRYTQDSVSLHRPSHPQVQCIFLNHHNQLFRLLFYELFAHSSIPASISYLSQKIGNKVMR